MGIYLIVTAFVFFWFGYFVACLMATSAANDREKYPGSRPIVRAGQGEFQKDYHGCRKCGRLTANAIYCDDCR